MHTLKTSNSPLKVVFDPQRGMNCKEITWREQAILDLSTQALFEERFAGLGALIGPHFHHRANKDLPPLRDPELFPFFESLQRKGQKEMFSHGIARYVPWKVVQKNENSIEATLCSSDSYKGYTLEELEGYPFKLFYKAHIEGPTLHIDYQFEADQPSVIGLHYYYTLENQKGRVISNVGPKYHYSKGWRPIESSWLQGPTQLDFKIDPEVEADFGFTAQEPESLGSQIKLVLSQYTVQIDYETDSAENSWQLYHPKGSTCVCLEPLTASNPREAVLKKGRLKVQIKIF